MKASPIWATSLNEVDTVYMSMEIILRYKWGYKCGGGEASKWIFLIEHPPASNSFLKHVKLWSAFNHHRLHNIPSNEFQNMVKPGIVEGH